MKALRLLNMLSLSKFVAAALAFAPLWVQAQVNASLVAADDSVQPGKSITVALRLAHEPGWHTYWISAGTGYPTSMDWKLPPGWTAGAFQWPTPIEIKNAAGTVTGNGYEGVIYLPNTLTAAADAKGSVTLDGEVAWLMCSDVCIPGSQAVSLTLPVSSAAPKPNAEVRAELAKMPLPQEPETFKIAAARDGKNVILQVSGGGKFQSPHFFSEDAFIQYDQPQIVTDGGGTLKMSLPINADAAQETQKLVGVLAYNDASGKYRGVKVAVRFASGEAGGGTATALLSHADAGPRATTQTPESAASLVATLLLAVAGGFILNLMPCVFPVLAIKVSGFVNEAGNDRRKISRHGLLFTLGVLLSFWALAGTLTVLRTGGEALGWGFQLQSPVFVFCLAVVMLSVGLSFSGVFEFGSSVMGTGSSLQLKQGYAGTFFAGVLAAVVATPCSAPFLAPALGAALILPVAQSFSVFTAIAVGLSLPYLLLSIFPDVVKVLPRPGRWMETFKQAMAFPMYATVGYLVWVLAGQTGENDLLMVLLGLTVIALGLWVYGRYSALAAAGRMRFGWMAGIALFAFGLNMGWPHPVTAGDITWEPWSQERVAQLQAEHRSIYVDFTARWCATCQANKKVVFSSNEVQQYFHDHNVAALEADWTNKDARITTELAKWNRSAIPFNLVYLHGQAQPKVLPEVLTPGIVLKALRG